MTTLRPAWLDTPLTEESARRHAAHLCDVIPLSDNDDHIGVIDRLRARNGTLEARVTGHPHYPARWFPVGELITACPIKD